MPNSPRSTKTIADDVRTIGQMATVPTILEAVARTTGLRFAAVARVTDNNWTACAVLDHLGFGLRPGGELQVETTICNEIRQHQRPVVFNQASTHPQFRSHPTPKLYGFESYISIPIVRASGEFFGTLCALDPLPAKLEDANVVRTLELFAQLIAANLDTAEQLERSAQELLAERDSALLREQFISILGHDLRNPLNSAWMAAEVLARKLGDSPQAPMVAILKRSCSRMAGLVDNLMDFARAKLGGGIPLSLTQSATLAADLEQVVAEARATSPGRDIRASIAIAEPVLCDSPRMAQLFTNLLMNAVTHGDPAQPVIVTASSAGGVFELEVANSGPAIPLAQLSRLFEPFTRASDFSGSGLGLGLFIAAAIAKAHNGRIEVVSSTAEGTRFVFSMQNAPAQAA